MCGRGELLWIKGYLHWKKYMNGCHSDLVPDRCKSDLVFHSDGKTSWNYIFTRDCQYSKQDIIDHNCNGCTSRDKK
jgi:hypothetical protein